MKISRLYKPIILTIYDLFFWDRSDTHVTHVVNPTTTTSQESILWRPFDISPRHIPNTLDEVDHDWIWGIILQWSNMVKLWVGFREYSCRLPAYNSASFEGYSWGYHKDRIIRMGLISIASCWFTSTSAARREQEAIDEHLMSLQGSVVQDGKVGGKDGTSAKH